MVKRIAIMLILLNFSGFVIGANEKPKEQASPGSDQKIVDFSLAGYNQRGKKSWEVKGNSADIFDDVVKLTDVDAKVYGEGENMKLVADNGQYDKSTGTMHLKDNVVVTTDSGGKLTTDSLDWDRSSQKVFTKDEVDVEKQNMKINAKGLEGEPNLKKISFKDDVTMEISPQKASPASDVFGISSESGAKEDKQPTVITCNGPLIIDYEKNVAFFNNNVKVDQKDQAEMYADKMEAYFDFKGKKIERVKSMGNVRIVNGGNTSYSDEALYDAAQKTMTLTGKPRLVIYSKDKLIDAPAGN